MNAFVTSQFSSVIPATAGTHGKPQQAFSRRQNTTLATFPISIHAERDAAYVGPGLRRDDGCGGGNVMHLSTSAAVRLVELWLTFALALLSPNQSAASWSACISSSELLEIAKPSARPLEQEEINLLAGSFDEDKLKSNAVVAYDVSTHDHPRVLVLYRNLKPAYVKQAGNPDTGSIRLVVRPANQNRVVSVEFNKINFYPDDMIKPCIHSPKESCRSEVLTFELNGHAHAFGLSIANGRIDLLSEGSGQGSCMIAKGQNHADAIKFWAGAFAGPITTQPKRTATP
jgi:hypothetical protein